MKSILRLSFFLILLLMVGCASGPKLQIRSSIPARIEANGTTVCASTPCEIQGAHYRDGYDAGCVQGKETPLEAFSLEPKGIRQTKNVRGECGEVTDVFFEMDSGGVVNTVTQNRPSKTTTEKLLELEGLKKRGLISESEFTQLRKEILDNHK